jgi:KipI family sensor histidine kinase inhibitor
MVRAAAGRIRDMQLSAVTDVVPAYTTLAVYFDSSRTSFAFMVSSIIEIVKTNTARLEEQSALIEIPVSYDGPDLAEVAEQTGLTVDEVIDRHTRRTYRAYASGFQPGFAYLGDLDESLALPRRTPPRVRVPAGSVAIAGAQTAVYPLQTPGGWHLIGTTSLTMFDANRNPPALIRAGDTVRFIRIDQ